MKQLIASLISALINRTPEFRGKVRLLRLLGKLCRGKYVQSRYGVLMQADLSDNTNLWALLGWYDGVANEIRKIKKGEAFLDIGSNAGLFSLMAGRLVGPEGVVIAFEPQKELFSRLVNNVQTNQLNNIFCFNLAVSDSSRIVAMNNIHAQHTGIASISENPTRSGNYSWAVAPSIDLRIVDQMSTDRTTTIKIDVEGHELQALRGIAKLLESHRVNKVIIEIDANNLKKFKSEVSDVYSFMSRYGFSPTIKDAGAIHYDEVFVRPHA